MLQTNVFNTDSKANGQIKSVSISITRTNSLRKNVFRRSRWHYLLLSSGTRPPCSPAERLMTCFQMGQTAGEFFTRHMIKLKDLLQLLMVSLRHPPIAFAVWFSSWHRPSALSLPQGANLAGQTEYLNKCDAGSSPRLRAVYFQSAVHFHIGRKDECFEFMYFLILRVTICV